MLTNKPDVPKQERHALRVNDATIFSGLSRASLYRAMKDGALRSVKIGKRRLILRADLEAFLLGGIQ
jgi:excisionase family DNA binding protein